jgi:exosortase
MKFDRRHLVLLLGTAVLLILKWQDILGLIRYASDLDNKNASQVFLIPFVSAFLIFLNRQEIFRNVHYASLAGALTIAAGLVLPAAVRLTGTQLNEGDNLALTTASILVTWVGLFLLSYGSTAFKVALFPLLFLAFSMPIPSAILDPMISLLQRGSAEIAYILIKLFGTPIYREGFVFKMPGLAIEVAPQCSGIRSCLSMLILTLLAGHLLLKTQWKRLALVMVAIPIMIFKNGVRIATLSLLSVHVDHRIIESSLHREGGIPFFILALVLIYPILTVLLKSERKESAGEPVLREVNP